MLLSIIIPIYNVEKYLKKCLDSCINQDVPSTEYEIIAINDGSPDNCWKILEQYKTLNNLKIINQSNQGLSVARNNGLKISSGEYVWFVDSDDTIVKNSLQEIIISLKKKPDLLFLNYNQTFEENEKIIEHVSSLDEKLIYNGKYVIENIKFPIPAQFTIYKKSFLLKNNLHFYPGIYHEDIEFKPRVVYQAKSIIWHKNTVYNHLQRTTGSITSRFSLKNGLGYITAMNSLHDFYTNYVKEKTAKRKFRQIISLIVNNVLFGLRKLDKEEQKTIILNLNQQTHIFKDMILSKNLKYITEGCLLFMNLKLAMRIHKMFR